LILALLIVAAIALLAIGYFIGRASLRESTGDVPPQPASVERQPVTTADAAAPPAVDNDSALRRMRAERDAALTRLQDLAADRSHLFSALATSREETAGYRQLVIDLEDEAPPPLLGGPGMPDNLKLIVGIGPVLERMLHQLGVTTFRQIARWNERDIDEIDAKLAEFHGRIRRDDWVAQARALHQSTYGETLASRGER
jgi:predicted flap endonuclease-1-like 5' DNA nuclease